MLLEQLTTTRQPAVSVCRNPVSALTCEKK